MPWSSSSFVTRGTSVMCAPDRIDRPDDVDVLLERGRRDHLGRLAKPGVDDLEALVAQAPGEHLGAAVVAVEPGLGDEHLERAVRHAPIVGVTARATRTRRRGGRPETPTAPVRRTCEAGRLGVGAAERARPRSRRR